jgi:hypothetical protein
MRATVFIIGCLLVPFSLGQGRAPRVEGPEHFRWSEASAHELDHKYTIRSAVGLSPRQRENLTKAVLQQLKRHKSLDSFFVGMPEQKLVELAANTRIERMDLNGDGNPEVLAQANGLGPCGGTGNCIFWIFAMSSGGVKVLLDTFDSEAGFEVIAIRPWSTNGFKDLVVGAHQSAGSRGLVWYKYAGGAYRRWRCYNLTGQGESGMPVKGSAIAQADCAEMFSSGK